MYKKGFFDSSLISTRAQIKKKLSFFTENLFQGIHGKLEFSVTCFSIPFASLLIVVLSKIVTRFNRRISRQGFENQA